MLRTASTLLMYVGHQTCGCTWKHHDDHRVGPLQQLLSHVLGARQSLFACGFFPLKDLTHCFARRGTVADGGAFGRWCLPTLCVPWVLGPAWAPTLCSDTNASSKLHPAVKESMQHAARGTAQRVAGQARRRCRGMCVQHKPVQRRPTGRADEPLKMCVQEVNPLSSYCCFQRNAPNGERWAAG